MPLQPLNPSPPESDPDTPDEDGGKEGEAIIPPSQDNGGSGGSNAQPEEAPIPETIILVLITSVA